MNVVSSQIAHHYMRRNINQVVEEFWVMALKPNKEAIHCQCLFRGTVDQCLIHPREIFKFAIDQRASSIIVAHSHPSNDLTPSKEDIELTHQLDKCGQLLQIPLVDHLILTEGGYFSFADQGLLLT